MAMHTTLSEGTVSSIVLPEHALYRPLDFPREQTLQVFRVRVGQLGEAHGAGSLAGTLPPNPRWNNLQAVRRTRTETVSRQKPEAMPMRDLLAHCDGDPF